MLQDLTDIIRRVIDPLLDARALYPAKVIADSGNGTVDIRPESPLWGEMQGVPFRSGVAGARTVLARGTRAYFGFENGDRRSPFVMLVDTAVSPIPTSTTLDAAAMTLGPSASSVVLASGSDTVPSGTETGRVVRYGDIIVFPVGPAGTPTPMPVQGGLPSTPTTVSKVKA